MTYTAYSTELLRRAILEAHGLALTPQEETLAALKGKNG